MSTRRPSRSLNAALRLAIACAAGVLAATPLQAQAQSTPHSAVTRYDVLRKELFSGMLVTAVFSPSSCNSGQAADVKAAAPAVHGGFAVRDFIEIEGSNIGFANQHLTVRPDGTAVLELMQYRVMPDDKVTVTVSLLSPVTYQQISAAQTFQCMIGAGVDFRIGPTGLLRE